MLKLENGRRALPGSLKTISLLCICASLAILCLLGLEAAAGKTVQKEEKKKPDGLELGLSEGGVKAAPEEAGKPAKATPLGEKETAAKKVETKVRFLTTKSRTCRRNALRRPRERGCWTGFGRSSCFSFNGTVFFPS